MKLRLVRLNPLTLEPGEFFVMCGRNLNVPVGETDVGTKFVQFPARLEYLSYQNDIGEMLLEKDAIWRPVEYVNEFLSDKDNDAREVRPEVQVPVYNESARNKRSRGTKGGESS